MAQASDPNSNNLVADILCVGYLGKLVDLSSEKLLVDNIKSYLDSNYSQDIRHAASISLGKIAI